MYCIRKTTQYYIAIYSQQRPWQNDCEPPPPQRINSNYTQQLYPISHILHPSQRPSNRIKEVGGNNITHWFVKTIHCGQVGILKPDVRTGVDLIAKPQKKNLSITGY